MLPITVSVRQIVPKEILPTTFNGDDHGSPFNVEDRVLKSFQGGTGL